MAEEILIVEKKEGIATLTMNRPRAMNALSAGLRIALAEAFEDLAADPEIRVVILTGQGERAFSAGLDLKELAGETDTGEEIPSTSGSSANPALALEVFDRPIIGAINGVAVTGGFELALACDVLIGSTNARFADTHARVGIMPGWGLSQKLSRVVGLYRAKELSLTGNFLGAQQAMDWGLLNRVVEPSALMQTCRELARDMISCQPELVMNYKDVIDRGFAASYEEGRRIETEANRSQLRSVSGQDLSAARKRVMKRGREQLG